MGGTSSKEASISGAPGPMNPDDCPVLNSRDGSGGASPSGAAGTSGADSNCPIPERYRRGSSPGVYNVYNQRIDELDPTNNMPRSAAQHMWEGQQQPLSTDRVKSSIPKGGTSDSWLYPSPQMFYNALMRKGKGEDVTEDIMDHVVNAHNTMNEATWQRVAEWERLHEDVCPDARLLRFMGRPDDLSPLARIKSWGGKQLPFDRHDWWVDRCGREVRYVIDFYYNENRTVDEAFELEVRPALDSPGALLDRVKMNIYIQCARWGVPCPLTGHSGKFNGASNASPSPPQRTQAQQ
mmetsp:Transcript_12208/g.36640  ORF Transcript_12208/g.36640 Transcript_12208/m.36640 type:complete len:294 (-) Transcript_12208:605-1486(-)